MDEAKQPFGSHDQSRPKQGAEVGEKILTELQGSSLDLFDNRDPKGPDVVASKVVDITSLCPGMEENARAVLKYARVTRGPLVQLNDCFEHEGEIRTGSTVLFYYVEMGEKGLAEHDNFVGWADRWNIGAHALARIVFQNAPENQTLGP